MSFSNAQNAQIAQNAQNAQNAQAEGAGGVSAMMAQALLVAREALAPMTEVAVTAPGAPQADLAARLRRIEPHFAVAALLSEATEGLRIAATAKALVIEAPGGRLVRIAPPGAGHLQDEVQLVAGYADLRAERMAEILCQTDQVLPFFSSILPVAPRWTPCTLLLAQVALDLATVLVQRAKLGFALPRPHVLSPDIQPIIPCPGHSAYPSGHATQAFALAGLLAALSGGASPALGSQLDRAAARIATNRTVAGLHYPSDSAAGAALGLAAAGWLVARASGGVAPDISFDGARWGKDAAAGSRDFHLPALCEAWEAGTCLTHATGGAAEAAPLLSAIWTAARREWEQRWG